MEKHFAFVTPSRRRVGYHTRTWLSSFCLFLANEERTLFPREKKVVSKHLSIINEAVHHVVMIHFFYIQIQILPLVEYNLANSDFKGP